jgi:hypothetical protein
MPARTVVYVCTAVALSAAASAQQPPPIRPLGPIERVSMEQLASVSGARALPDGRVIVNDITGHRVMLFDSTLSLVKVIADSTASTNKAYGRSLGNLITYHGDSTLFVDLSSYSMLLLDDDGKIARVIAMPRTGDATYLLGNIFGTPAFDMQGRLIHRGATALGPITASAPGRQPIRQPPDSAPLVRADLEKRTKDTVALYKITSVVRVGNTTDNAENFTFHTVTDPLPLVDDWAVLTDGSIAIIRGRDYHIDWLHTDGTRSSSPRIPFDWKHLSDDDKSRMIDSLKAIAMARYDSAVIERNKEAVAGGGAPHQYPPAEAAVFFVAPKDLPDYIPPFTQGAARADADGNVWIRTSKFVKGQPVYDVIDARGELIDRVQLPPFRSIAGFGAGVIYMGVLDSAKVAHLERARVR